MSGAPVRRMYSFNSICRMVVTLPFWASGWLEGLPGDPCYTQSRTGTWSVLLFVALQCPVLYITVALSAQCISSATGSVALQCPVHLQCHRFCCTPVPSAAQCLPETKNLSVKMGQIIIRALRASLCQQALLMRPPLVQFRVFSE